MVPGYWSGKGLDQPIADFLPELAKDPEKRKREITIEDLLTRRSGLESTSGRGYGGQLVFIVTDLQLVVAPLPGRTQAASVATIVAPPTISSNRP